MSLLVMGLVALGSALLAGGGAHVYHQNKFDQMRAEFQRKIDELQGRIQALIEKIREKDEEILRLTNKVAALEGQLEEEISKRDQINQMIGTLLARQKKVESILHALVLIISFRIRNWGVEKAELRKQLQDARLGAQEAEALIAQIETEKAKVLVRKDDAENAKSAFESEHEGLVEEMMSVKRQMEEEC